MKYLTVIALILMVGCVQKLQTKTTDTFYDLPTGKVTKVTETLKEETAWPLAKKAVSIEQDVTLFSLEVVASPETQGYPVPNIKYLRGNSAIDSMPMVNWGNVDSDRLFNLTNYSESLTIESSYWDDSVAFFKHRRKGSGTSIPANPIQYKMNINIGTDTSRSNMFNSIFGGK